MTIKFESKEKLIRKIKHDNDNDYKKEWYNAGINDAFKEFAKHIDFYNRYESNFYLFEKEQKELCDEYFKRFVVRISDTWLKEYFNAWLFDYCFGDIE